MRLRIQNFSAMSLIVFLIASISIMSCDEQELGEKALTGQHKTYNLNPVSNSGISGTITLEEGTDHSTRVTIHLDGTIPSKMYQAHFYENSIAETGKAMIELHSVDGTTGKSETIVSTMKNGNTISYDQLLSLNSHVNITLSETDFVRIIAQADTGGNETTGIFKSYTLSPTDSDISGSVQFNKRVNGNTLVVVDLIGTSPIGSYMAFICENDAASGGKVVIKLNTVHGGLPISFTNVDQLIDSTAISYDQLMDFDGHVRVVSNESAPKCMAKSNIGVNVSSGLLMSDAGRLN